MRTPTIFHSPQQTTDDDENTATAARMIKRIGP
jgi:hypothetical protein